MQYVIALYHLLASICASPFNVILVCCKAR
jgi:hypothetical protein